MRPGALWLKRESRGLGSREGVGLEVRDARQLLQREPFRGAQRHRRDARYRVQWLWLVDQHAAPPFPILKQAKGLSATVDGGLAEGSGNPIVAVHSLLTHEVMLQQCGMGQEDQVTIAVAQQCAPRGETVGSPGDAPAPCPFLRLPSSGTGVKPAPRD